MSPGKLDREVRTVSAGIAYTLPEGYEDNDVPTFWLQPLLTLGIYGPSSSIKIPDIFGSAIILCVCFFMTRWYVLLTV